MPNIGMSSPLESAYRTSCQRISGWREAGLLCQQAMEGVFDDKTTQGGRIILFAQIPSSMAIYPITGVTVIAAALTESATKW